MKRVISLVVAAAMTAGFLTGCGSSGTQGGNAKTEAVKEEPKTEESKEMDSNEEKPKAEGADGKTVKITYLSRFVNPELVRAGYYIETVSYTHLDVYKRQSLCAESRAYTGGSRGG